MPPISVSRSPAVLGRRPVTQPRPVRQGGPVGARAVATLPEMPLVPTAAPRVAPLHLARADARSYGLLSPAPVLVDPGPIAPSPVDLAPECSWGGIRDPRHLLRGLQALRPPLVAAEARLRALNIEYLARFSDARVLRELIAHREAAVLDPQRKIAVLVYPKYDEVRAFEDTSIATLRGHGFQVLYYEAGSDQELIAALVDAKSKGRASYVELGAHGAQGMMAFGFHPAERRPDGFPGDRDTLDWSDLEQLRAAGLRDLFTTDGVLELKSCSTGMGKEGARNVANLLHEIFPAQTIYAPTEPAKSEPRFDRRGGLTSPGYRVHLSSNVYKVEPEPEPS